VDAGVFLGNPSARIREKLWDRISNKNKNGYALQLWSDSSTVQGYRFRSMGTNARMFADFDGISLITRTRKSLIIEKDVDVKPADSASD
jgi:CRISPR-associated protein Cas2